MSAEYEYARIHRDVVMCHGKANVNACTFCGGTATDWAYNWRDSKQREADGRVWSESTAYYIPLCRTDHKLFDAAYRRVGLAGLDAEVERLKPLAWARLTDERREVEAQQRTRQFEINEAVIAANEERVFARHETRQAKLREEAAARAKREAERAMTQESTLHGFFPGILVPADESARLLADEAFRAYAAWCEREAFPARFRMGRSTFYRVLAEHGVERRKTSEGVTFFGIALI
ncbi:hypothetical protein ACIA6T_07920 [Streptomyces sp. NPDC051740]|uniref:hypothetical protein n=1 Tax=Streptomyces sp. NPDC051740 TaxID=3365673 RepID=UPI0037A90261